MSHPEIDHRTWNACIRSCRGSQCGPGLRLRCDPELQAHIWQHGPNPEHVLIVPWSLADQYPPVRDWLWHCHYVDPFRVPEQDGQVETVGLLRA